MGSSGNVLHKKLIERAQNSEEPVTELEEISDHRTIYRAVQESDGVVWRAQIDTLDERGEYECTPRVSFQKCRPGSGCESLRSWTGLATGALSGPQELPDWEALFTVFNATLKLYRTEENDG